MTIRLPSDYVGEGAAAIDPELPLLLNIFGMHGEFIVCHNLDVFRSLVMDLVRSMFFVHERCSAAHHSSDPHD